MVSERIAFEDRHLAVIGLGYVGLGLALDLVAAGYQVDGVDKDPGRLDLLRGGGDGSPHHGGITDALATGRLRFKTSRADSPATAHFVCVPTPVTADRRPDISHVLSAASELAATMRPDALVVLQSTTYPGTTAGPFRTALESGGKRAGRDFHLAYSPERSNPGSSLNAAAVPRIVAGLDGQATSRTKKILASIAERVIVATSPDAAELCKLFENVFRSVNIALVNELAVLCERLGIDVWEVVATAASKPFGFIPFSPSAGVGGHCIPVDPYYFIHALERAGIADSLASRAAAVNGSMPSHVIGLVQQALAFRGKSALGARVLVVGAAYKPGVSDSRNSPAAGIIEGLRVSGADVTYHDPRVPWFDSCDAHVSDHPSIAVPCSSGMASAPLNEALSQEPDCVVFVTCHPEIGVERIVGAVDLVVDTCNATSRLRTAVSAHILRLGAGWLQ